MSRPLDGRFYAEDNAVWRAPKERNNDDSSRSITMGFRVCTICEGVSDDGAGAIAKGLNLLLDEGIIE